MELIYDLGDISSNTFGAVGRNLEKDRAGRIYIPPTLSDSSSTPPPPQSDKRKY